MRNILIATALTAALGATTPTFAHAAPGDVPAQTSPTRAPAQAHGATTAATPDDARYADAESKNPDAADFTGGSAVIFVGSTTAMILAILLILVIL
jgi:hypothetical protein